MAMAWDFLQRTPAASENTQECSSTVVVPCFVKRHSLPDAGLGHDGHGVVGGVAEDSGAHHGRQVVHIHLVHLFFIQQAWSNNLCSFFFSKSKLFVSSFYVLD